MHKKTLHFYKVPGNLWEVIAAPSATTINTPLTYVYMYMKQNILCTVPPTPFIQRNTLVQLWSKLQYFLWKKQTLYLGL